MTMIESLSNFELNKLHEQANQGGEYEAARGLLGREMARRARIIEAMHSVDEPYLVPQDPSDLTTCESCD